MATLTPSQINYGEAEQWRQIIRQELADTRCATTAFLTEDLDPTHQTVTVQIAIQERVRTAEGAQWWDVAPIINVPIIIPRGGGFSVTLPLKKGDEGLLVFCDTCFDFWWQNGKNNSPVANNNTSPSGTQRQFEVRRHHIHDCGFIPGMYSQPNVLSDYSTDSLQLRSDDGNTIIDVAEDGVTVTGQNVVVNASSVAQVTAPQIHANASGGTALALVNDNFYRWFVDIYMPSVVYVSSEPVLPANPETTILKGQ